MAIQSCAAGLVTPEYETVIVPPGSTEVGEAERVTGVGAVPSTVTVTEEGADVPPGPEHVIE
jgi:hypothetical protein